MSNVNTTAGFWQQLSRRRHFMLAAIAVMTVAQFYPCREKESSGILSVGPDYGTDGRYKIDPNPAGTGWQVHPHDYVILPVLALVFLTNACESAWWRKRGYLAAFFLVWIALAPGQIWMKGTRIGYVALALAGYAAYINRQDRLGATSQA